jgi:FHS family Na+ dependent glucose MFS transporter 1
MTTQSVLKQNNAIAATIMYYLSFVMLGLSLGVEGPSLPVLARHTASSLDRISLMFVFGSLGYLLGSFFGGLAYDRLPGHRFMAVTLAAMAAGITAVPLASALWTLLLVVFLLGMAKGALEVGCNTLLQWTHGNRVGPYMNGLHFCFGVGSFVAPLIIARILSATGDILWAFWSIALVCLPLAVWVWTSPDQPAHARSAKATGPSTPLLPAVLIALSFFLYVGAEVGFGSWIYTYAVTLELGTTVTAAYLTSAFWGLFTVGRLLGVWISTRVRAQTILLVDIAGCLSCLALIMLGSASSNVLWAGSVGLGLFMASIFPTLLMLAAERMRITGALTGWFMVGSGAGGMLLPWLIGQAFVSIGPRSMPVFIFVDVVANLSVLLWFLTNRANHPAVQAIQVD